MKVENLDTYWKSTAFFSHVQYSNSSILVRKDIGTRRETTFVLIVTYSLQIILQKV
jgi:hypothetical protein